MVWIHIFWEIKRNLLVYRLIRNETLLVLFNSKQRSHEIKFTLWYSLSGIKYLWKALFMYTFLILVSDQNASEESASFLRGRCPAEGHLGNTVLNHKSSGPALAFILQVKLISHLHATAQRWRPGGTVWRYFRRTALRWGNYHKHTIDVFICKSRGWALVTRDTHRAGAQVNKNFSAFSWLRGKSGIRVF